MTLLELKQTRTQDVIADVGSMFDDLLVFHELDGGNGCGTGQGVARIGEATGVDALCKGLVNGLRDNDATQWQIPRVHALGEGDEVRRGPKVIEGEPRAGAAKSSHHLIGDPHDAVAVTNLANTLEVSSRRNHDAGSTRNGFQNDGGNGVRALHANGVLKVFKGTFALLLFGFGVELRAVEEGTEEVHNASRSLI